MRSVVRFQGSGCVLCRDDSYISLEFCANGIKSHARAKFVQSSNRSLFALVLSSGGDLFQLCWACHMRFNIGSIPEDRMWLYIDYIIQIRKSCNLS